MTTVADRPIVRFTLDPEHEAHEPPEARGLRRDRVRLLVSRGDAEPVDATFADLGSFLNPGDAITVNVSATIPAALDGRLPDGEPVVVHLSGSLPGDVWLVEVRTPRDGASVPRSLPDAVDVALLDGGHVQLLTPFAGSRRMWIAHLALAPSPLAYASRYGRPIRYRHVTTDWPLSAYQTVFAQRRGSVEMPSASRPFTPELVTELVARGVQVLPLVLHAGVSSLEGDERPYPERYRVPDATAAALNAVRRDGGRIVAAGTTVVRALATVTDHHGFVHPGRGWTDVVVTPDAPVASVDGLLTGWHEPESSHLQMLAAFLSGDALNRAYAAALDRGYLWHEFGDSHLLLRTSIPAPMTDAAPTTLPPGRRAVLYALRRRGEATAEQLAEQLAMTVSGARQHLTVLTRDGLVSATERASHAGKRGRRTLVYAATPAADALFPKAYGELTNELLGYVAETDATMLEELFAKRREHRVRTAHERLARKRTLGARVTELTRILDEDGYLATSEKIAPGTYRVVEHNCAIWAVAQRYGQACTSEIDFIRGVLPDARVERVQHMVAGAPHCAYEITARAGAEEGAVTARR